MDDNTKVKEFKEYEDVESFAKLEGPNFKQYIHKYTVFLGRDCNSNGLEGLNEEQIIFIGDSQKISRRHAVISWNNNKGEWEIEILSKNKAVVNGITLRKGDPPINLVSCAAIKIDKYKFYFFPAIPE